MSKRPKSIYFFFVSLIITPAFVLLFEKLQSENFVFIQVPPSLDRILLSLLILQGFLILVRSRISYFLALGISLYLIAIHLSMFLSIKNIFEIYSVSIAFFQIILLIYLTSSEIFYPYLASDSRGWRSRKRRNIPLRIRINDDVFPIKDISERGFFVLADKHEFSLNQNLECSLLFSKGAILLKAQINRLDESGFSASFEKLDWKSSQSLRAVIQEEQIVYG